MHWLSDAVAGGLMGWAIGSTVGTRFRQGFDANAKDSGPWVALAPGTAFGVTTMNVIVVF